MRVLDFRYCYLQGYLGVFVARVHWVGALTAGVGRVTAWSMIDYGYGSGHGGLVVAVIMMS